MIYRYEGKGEEGRRRRLMIMMRAVNREESYVWLVRGFKVHALEGYIVGKTLRADTDIETRLPTL